MSQLKVYDLYLQSLDQIGAEERGQINIDRWNRSARTAVNEFIDFLTGRLIDEPTPQLGLMKTQKIGDLLRPIIKREMVSFESGLVPYPNQKYDYLVDLRITGNQNWKPGDCASLPAYTIDQILNGQSGFKQVDVLSHDEIATRINTHIPLLKERACAEQYGDGFLIYNCESQGSAFYVFLIEPPETTLGMTEDPNTHAFIPDQNTSVDPPFDKKVGPFLARKIAQLYFQFTREEAAIGTSDAIAKTP